MANIRGHRPGEREMEEEIRRLRLELHNANQAYENLRAEYERARDTLGERGIILFESDDLADGIVEFTAARERLEREG